MQNVFEKIIERLKELKTDNSCRSCQYREKCNEVQETASESTDLCGATMKSLAIEIVNQVASEYGGGWIPCSERLPQEDEPEEALCEIVNITLKNGTVTVGWCNRYLEQWFVLDEHCDYPISRKYEDVLAWQPLPPVYKAENEE